MMMTALVLPMASLVTWPTILIASASAVLSSQLQSRKNKYIIIGNIISYRVAKQINY